MNEIIRVKYINFNFIKKKKHNLQKKSSFKTAVISRDRNTNYAMVKGSMYVHTSLLAYFHS